VNEKAIYTFSLQSGSKQLVKGLQLLLLLTNAAFLIILVLSVNHVMKIALLILPFFSLLLFYYAWEKKKNNRQVTQTKLLLVLGLSFAINWLANFYWIPGLGMIVISYLFLQAIRPTTILFSNAHVKLHTFPIHLYSWKEIDQVILRDEILTLNFIDNRFIQHQIHLPQDFNTDQFNHFCVLHLESVHKL
jgi:hypothetical protein